MQVDTLEHFGGDHREVGVGHKFDHYDDGDVALYPGDVVVWRDPDAGHHVGDCELIQDSIFVGKIRGVYAVDYDHEDGFSVELDTAMPIGRIDADGPYTGVVGEDHRTAINTFGMDGTQSYADSFLNGDYERYFHWESHLGEDGVPAGLWDAYDDGTRSGPGCPYCTGEKGTDGVKIEGE